MSESSSRVKAFVKATRVATAVNAYERLRLIITYTTHCHTKCYSNSTIQLKLSLLSAGFNFSCVCVLVCVCLSCVYALRKELLFLIWPKQIAKTPAA